MRVSGNMVSPSNNNDDIGESSGTSYNTLRFPKNQCAVCYTHIYIDRYIHTASLSLSPSLSLSFHSLFSSSSSSSSSLSLSFSLKFKKDFISPLLTQNWAIRLWCYNILKRWRHFIPTHALSPYFLTVATSSYLSTFSYPYNSPVSFLLISYWLLFIGHYKKMIINYWLLILLYTFYSSCYLWKWREIIAIIIDMKLNYFIIGVINMLQYRSLILNQ